MAKKSKIDKNSNVGSQPDGMELSEFIENSLVDIILGVHSAKNRVRDIASILPGSLDGKPDR